MKKNTPPFITPFAILSIIVLIGTSNLVVNRVTHTKEGAPARPTRVINNQNRQPNNNSSVNQQPRTGTDQQKPQNSPSNSESGDRSDNSAPKRNPQNRSQSVDNSRSDNSNNRQSGPAQSRGKSEQNNSNNSANSTQKK